MATSKYTPRSATGTRFAIGLPLTIPEKAILTYEALDQCEDVVLLLESYGGAAAVDAAFISGNGAFRRATGFSAGELIGLKTAALFQVGDDAEILMKAIREGGTLRGELTCSRANGDTFMLGLLLTPAKGEEDDHRRFVILGRDITGILATRRAQDSTQRLLAKVFMCVADGVSIVNSAGQMVMTNPAFDRLLGYKADEVAGRTSLDMVAPECRTSIAAMIDLQYEKNETMNYCATYLRADGSKQAVRVTSAIVTMEDAKQFRILTVLPDTAVAKTMRRETAGRINLVGLDDVRAALGDRWQARAERVMATAEAIIKRRCGVEDSFSRADDTSFLICFGSLNETEAAFRAATIGREIRDRLIGQGDDPDNAFVRSIAATVRLPDGEIGSAADSRGFLLDGLDKELGRVEQAARETLQAAWASADCELEPVLGLGQTDTIANHVRLPDELQRRLASAQAALPRKESEAFDLDALLLGLAARQAIGDMAKGLSMPLMVNVRFDVFLTRRATERYFATCLKIDQRVGTRLILMLSALPQGLPKARLLDCVTRLRPFCRAVGYRIDSLADLAIIELSNSSIRSWRCPRRRCPARRRTSAGPRSTRSMPGGRGFWSMALNRRGQPPACGRLAPI